MELASRDVVSRAEWKEIEEGRGVDGCVLLDLTHLGAKKIHTRLPGSRELAHRLRGRRSDRRADPGPARRPLPHGRRRRRRRRRDDPARPVRRGRVRLRLGARRQPPRRQLADGDDHVRPPRRAATPAQDAVAHRNGALVRRVGRARRGARASARSSPARAASGRGRCARSSRRSMYDNAGIFRTARAPRATASTDDRTSCASAVGERRRRRHGRPLQHRPHLGARARVDARDGRLPRHGRARAPGVARRAHAPRLPRARRREVDEAHARLARRRQGPARLQAGHRHPLRARWCGATEGRCGWKSPSRSGARPTAPSHTTRDLHGRGRRDGHAARRARRRQGQAATARSPTASRAAWPSAARAACAWTAARCWPARRR